MGTMSGMIADKTLRIRRMMRKLKATMITAATGIIETITETKKKTDAPNRTALELVAGPITAEARTKKKKFISLKKMK
jgi:hypothetical protein